MGFLDLIFRRNRSPRETVPPLPKSASLTAEQATTNREVMEAEMLESRRKRESEAPRS